MAQYSRAGGSLRRCFGIDQLGLGDWRAVEFLLQRGSVTLGEGLQRYWLPGIGRPVERADDPDVCQPFPARRLGRVSVDDALRKADQLGRELVPLGESLAPGAAVHGDLLR